MKNYSQKGETVTAPAPRGVVSGEFAKLGASIGGVASSGYALNEEGEFVTCGVFDLAKASGVAISRFADVYWDDTAHRCTAVSAGNMKIGSAILAAAALDSAVRVRLAI